MDIKQLCEAVGEYLHRVKIKGSEVRRWTEAFNWVDSIHDGEIVPVSKEDFKGLLKDRVDLGEIWAALVLDSDSSPERAVERIQKIFEARESVEGGNLNS